MSPALPDATATRKDFQYFLRLQTRWNDMDAYRHLSNARYYAFFDTVIMESLQGGGQIASTDQCSRLRAKICAGFFARSPSPM